MFFFEKKNQKTFVLALVASAWAHTAQAAAPDAIIDLQTIPHVGAVFKARVNGQEGLFLFDTGGGITVISPELAHRVGCTPWGRITGFRMTGQRLDFPRCDSLRVATAGANFTLPTAGVFDIMALMPGSQTQLAGSAGLDLFAGHRITIDTAAHHLIVESPASFAERIRHATEVPVRLVRDAEGAALAIDVAVPTKSGTAWMELDTGNGGTLVIGQHIAPLLGLDPNSKAAQPAHFTLASGTPITGEARVRDLIMDGNIGQRTWSHWTLTLDLQTPRLYLTQAPSP